MAVDSACDAYLEEHDARHLEELKEFLRIPSVSSLPEHRDDVRHAAEWVADRLRELGAQGVELLPTGGNPVVYGEWPAPEGAPTALLYGHYDVQPPDPLDLWESPPFEPTVRDGKLYARGAADDKGNMFAPLKAIEALVATQGRVPIGLKCLFEGEEEVGSPSLPGFVRDNAARLKADFALSADGGMWGLDTPSLTLGSKGVAACQLDLRTANTDLHSGQYGAAVPNAVEALARLVTTMHDDAGRVTVPGFYDAVRELSAEERAQIAQVPFDEEEYRGRLGLEALWGEPGYTVLERAWARPTLDLNGIWGGFTGEGLKTVTPCEAHAKITCRLVPTQDPDRIRALLRAHVERHRPPGVRVSLGDRTGGAKPYLIPADHWGNRAAAAVLKELYGREPLHVRSGGTVPVMDLFKTTLGAETVGFGFGQDDEHFHAPDEFMRLANFERGLRGYCMLFQHLGAASPASSGTGSR
jgi:acetylornithine deacetylase/succinyl-diaminopimelate desuccinylase-like protein